ncbi:MAG: hypothetical protein WBP26_01975 [Candidatus Saccharimonadales bacterium]
MNSLFENKTILTIGAHPDDIEMHFAGAIAQSSRAIGLVASDGEASTLNYSGHYLCPR